MCVERMLKRISSGKRYCRAEIGDLGSIAELSSGVSDFGTLVSDLRSLGLVIAE